MSRSLKNIGIVSAATMVSRMLGLGRDMLVYGVFGTSALASAFVTAFTLPNLFRRLLGEGALTAALVPTLHDELARSRAAAFGLVNQVASWLGCATLILVAVSMAVLAGFVDAAWWQRWAGDADQAARWRMAAELAVVLFPYLIFVCLAAAFSAALQTLGRFLEPALSPIWLNLSMIGLLAWAVVGGGADGDAGRMRWLCGGVLLGGFLQMIVPAGALMREGWRPRLDLTMGPGVRGILVLMGPTVLGSAVYLINLAVSRVIGLSLNDGAAALLNLATRLMELPIGVFAIAVTTVVFPLISGHAARGEWGPFGDAYRKGVRLVLAVNVPAAAGLVVLAGPIIRVLFERGAFGPEDTAAMTPVLALFAAGLPLVSYTSLMLRAYYAQKDTRTPVHAALLSFGVNVTLSLVLMGPLSTVGLALASNGAVAVQAVYLQRGLRQRQGDLRFTPLLPDLGRILAASTLMALVVAAGVRALAGLGDGVGADAMRLALLIPTGGAVYAAAVWSLRLTGREELWKLLRRRRAGAGVPGGAGGPKGGAR